MRGNKPATIVVVEDDLDTASLFRTLLESDGHIVFTASNCVDAFALIQLHLPDLTLVDFVLIGSCNGLELVKKIRSRADLATVRLLMVSARTFRDEETRVMIDASVGLLPKPFRSAQFREAVVSELSSATTKVH